MTLNNHRIRALNDQFRRTGFGGKIMLTCTVAALPTEKQAEIMRRVHTFTDFDEKNDPHGEHDMGFFEIGGSKYWFKLDYYDRSMEYGSPDAADPTLTVRVLTIGAPEDY